jgi:hypothetical protein
MFEGQKTKEPKPIGHGQPQPVVSFLVNLDAFYKSQADLTENDKINLKNQFNTIKRKFKKISVNKLPVSNEHKSFLRQVCQN